MKTLINLVLTYINNGHVCTKGLLGYPCDGRNCH